MLFLWIFLGDKYQLPPYDPMAGRRSSYGQRRSSGTLGMREIKPMAIRSLLDCSVLDPDNGKIMLTTQYRVVSAPCLVCIN